MTRDIDVLTAWIKGCLYTAAFFTTSFPVLYLFSPWYSTKLGRLLMLQAVAFALIVDVTVLFLFWSPSDILVTFWIEAFCFSFVAVATGLLTVMLWRTNHKGWSLHRVKKWQRRSTDVE